MRFPCAVIKYTTSLVRNPRLNLAAIQRIQFYSDKPRRPRAVEGISESVLPTKGKQPVIPRITLLSGDEVTVTTLDEAQKLSKRRELKLVKIIDLDTKTERPVYKLMTAAEYHAEDLKSKKQKKEANSAIKGDKLLMLNAVISEHDLQVQVKKILKWINKQLEVRVVISGDADKCEKVYSSLEEALKNQSRFVQKRSKGNDMKFQILPPKNDAKPKNAPL